MTLGPNHPLPDAVGSHPSAVGSEFGPAGSGFDVADHDDVVAPSATDKDEFPLLSAVVVGNNAFTNHAANLMRLHLEGECEIHMVESMEDVPAIQEKIGYFAILVVSVQPNGPTPDDLIRPFFEIPENSPTRVIVLTMSREISGVTWLTDQGRLDFLCYAPELISAPFLENVEDQLRRYRMAVGLKVPRYRPNSERFIFDMPQTDAEIIELIMAGVDETLGFQPRILVPAGTRLTIEDETVEEVTLALRGRVALTRQSDAGSIIMHHASTGQIIGLLALTDQRKAFFTSRTTTEVLGVHLTFEQLNYVIHQRPQIALLVAVLSIRSLDRRLRRSEHIQIEKVELMEELEIERENLARALRNLEAAREELMSQARFASLGELAAGVAHELNNPMAAIQRTAEHLGDDARRLIESSSDPKWVRRTKAALEYAQESPALSTKEARQLRAELTEATKDPALAQRLVLAGIHDKDLAKEVAKSQHMSFDTIETAASIGSGLRNLDTASRRITELVASLRSYARPDGDPVTDVDIHQGINDTIRLLSHRLRGVEVYRHYGELPHIACHPGQLSQVWTNLMTNAAEAMIEAAPEGATEYGQITITTDQPEQGLVRVVVADNGPGMPPEVLEHLFEPRFTTKNGQVRFGMGIGLGVCKSIVMKHRGTINFESSPEGTRATVILPVDGPLADEEEA